MPALAGEPVARWTSLLTRQTPKAWGDGITAKVLFQTVPVAILVPAAA